MAALVAPDKALYLADIAASDAAAVSSETLRTRRRRAATTFEALAFPTVRQEDWKYTNVAPLLRVPFRAADSAPIVAAGDLPQYRGGAPNWVHLVLVNGEYNETLSTIPTVAGLTCGPLSADLAAAELHLGTLAEPERNAFIAGNTAALRDAAMIHVAAGRVIETPIHLVFAAVATDHDTVSYPRVLIVLERGSMATVVESYVSVGAAQSAYCTFSNAVTEVVLGDGAGLVHHKLLREADSAYHVGWTDVRQERDSTFTSYVVSLGNALSRNDLHIDLRGEGASCNLTGLYLASGTQHMDHHTAIDHRSPHGTSRESYKGILGGRARAVFNGKVVVHNGAHATDAQQSNRNLILSDDARVDTKPQLEINDDDVTCTHGATVGQLDEDQVFYLRARGLSERCARTLLTLGFANELLTHVPLEAVRIDLERQIAARLEPETPAEDLPHV